MLPGPSTRGVILLEKTSADVSIFFSSFLSDSFAMGAVVLSVSVGSVSISSVHITWLNYKIDRNHLVQS